MGTRLRFQRPGCGLRPRRSAPSWAADRRPRQQRRNDSAKPGGRARRQGLGRGLRGQPHGAVRAHPRDRPAHAGARSREDRLHRLAPLVPGRDQRPRVRSEQGWHRAADEGVRERVGRARRQRQRGRAGLHRDRQHAGAPRRPEPLDTRSWSGFRPDDGERPPTSQAPCCSSPPQRPTTFTASCSPSTGDGSAGDREGAGPFTASRHQLGQGAFFLIGAYTSPMLTVGIDP